MVKASLRALLGDEGARMIVLSEKDPGLESELESGRRILEPERSEGRGSGPLGSIAKSVNPPLSDSNKSKRYKLHGVAMHVLPQHKRLHSCHRVRIAGHVGVMRHSGGTGNAHYTGLATCGNVWICPVCSAKISERRKIELTEALERGKAQGYKLYFMTLTIPHYSNDRLDDLLEKFGRARKLFKNRKTWKRYAAGSGIYHSIRALEVTHGYDNGWHVHSHEILFVKPRALGSDLSIGGDFDVLGMWQRACVSAGLPEPNEHGLTIQGGDYSAEYAAKWGMVQELTKTQQKTGTTIRNDHYSPWQLLATYASTGEEELADHFREYAKCFKGKRQLVWSAGLRKTLGMGQEKTDEQLAAEEAPGSELVCFITSEDWKLIVKCEMRGEVLDVAREGPEAVFKFIDGLRGG